MPVGTTINAGYYGVTLMKGNNEFIAGSRKYTNIQFQQLVQVGPWLLYQQLYQIILKEPQHPKQ
jgi:hypothetical protein